MDIETYAILKSYIDQKSTGGGSVDPSNYVTQDKLKTTLADYAKSSSLASYATQNWVKTYLAAQLEVIENGAY